MKIRIYGFIFCFLLISESVGTLAAQQSDRSEEARIQIDKMRIPFNDQEFLRAILNGQPELVKLFLKAGMSPDSIARDGRTALIEAASTGHTEIVMMLLQAGAQVNAKDLNDRTALLAATELGYMMAVYELIEAGADINVKDRIKEMTPLQLAIDGGYSDIVELLLNRGAKLGRINEISSNELIVATGRPPCKSEIVHQLIDAGVEINVQVPAHNRGLTPLMAAAANGCEDIVEMLIAAGADIEATDWYHHRTALMHAVIENKLETVDKLLKRGARVNIHDSEWITPLMIAVKQNSQDVVKALLIHGADANAKERFTGRTVLMLAAFFGNSDSIKLLLHNGALINETDNDGWTALHWSVFQGSRSLLKTIMTLENNALPYRDESEYKISVDDTSRLNCVQLLIKSGARLKASSITLGVTPLMWAAFDGNEQVVHSLINAGADINARTNYCGLNAIDFAELAENADIGSLLIKENHESGSQNTTSANEHFLDCKNFLLMEIIRKIPWSYTPQEPQFDVYGDTYVMIFTANPALKELSKSKEGNELLLQFIYAHPAIDSNNIISSMNFDLIKHKLKRKFWDFLTAHLEKFEGTNASWASKLPYEERLKLVDVWLKWLRMASEAAMHNKNTNMSGSQDQQFCHSVIQPAIAALYGIYDNRITPALHKLFDSSKCLYQLCEAAKILYSIGDPESYSYIESCGDRGSVQKIFLQIANEKYALRYAKKIGFPQLAFLNEFPEQRCDLARGLTPYILHDSTLIQFIKDNSTKSLSWNLNKLFNIILHGATVLPDSELVSWLLKAEEWGSSDFMKIWIDLLGERDSVVGFNELFRLSSMDCTDQGEKGLQCRKIRNAAARALGKRLLGAHREEILIGLKAMPEIQRGIMVQCIMGAMGIFPTINSPCIEKSIECIGCKPDNHFPGHYDVEQEPNAGILRKHENKLLDWIKWAPANTDLAFTYGFMKSAEAQHRFMTQLDSVVPSAVMFSWKYKKYPSVAMLNGLRYYFTGREPYQTMMLFMLSESGNDEAYMLLKEQIKSQTSESILVDIYKLMLEESFRRKDFAWLNEEASNFTNLPEITGSHLSLYENISLFRKILTLLLKYDPDNGMRIVQTIDLSRAIYRESIIEACIDARTKNCESALKSVAPYYDAMRTELRKDWEKTRTWERWISAIQNTNTTWCKEQVVQNADYLDQKLFAVLAAMGDQRAISLSQTPDKADKHLLHWLDALKMGEVKIAATHPELKQTVQFLESSASVISGNYVLSQRINTPIDLAQWTPEQIHLAHEKLLLQFNTLPSYVRFELVQRIGSTYLIWNDDLILKALHDPYTPVRLIMLCILQSYPRESMLPEVRFISAHDPIPWCRRIANQLLQKCGDSMI